jgi:hypothetical protein
VTNGAGTATTAMNEIAIATIVIAASFRAGGSD